MLNRSLLLIVLVGCAGKDNAPVATTPPPTTPTITGCPPVTAAAAAVSEGQPLEVALDVALSEPADVWAVCTDRAEPTDRHLVEAAGPAATHRLLVRGLAPERTYTCAVHVACDGGETAEVAVTTGSLPADVSTFTVTRGAGETWGSYTLFNDMAACVDYDHTDVHVLIVDPDGVPRWHYEVPEPLKSLDLDTRYLGDGEIHVAGGWGEYDLTAPHVGVMRTVNLSNEVVLDKPAPDLGLGFNHHSELLPTGEFLTLTYTYHEFGGAFVGGIEVEVWDPVADALTWDWDSGDALATGQVPDNGLRTFFAANSVAFVDDALGPAMYLSVVTMDQLWRVDRETGDVTHVIGVGGTFTLLDPAGAPLPDEEWFYFQHDPEYTADGKVLMHDNGQGRPGPGTTRVVEYQLDLDAHTVTRLWQWTEDGWYNPFLGDADRLPNDDVLVTTAFVSCAVPGTGRSSVFDLEPTTGAVKWRLDWDNDAYTPFRAERIEGCEVFANARHCPAVAERIAELEGE